MKYRSVLLFLQSQQHWINIPEDDENSISKASSDDNEDDESSDLIVVWETAVQPLTDAQRLIFFIITVAVAFVAIVGNALVLYVNFSRFVG